MTAIDRHGRPLLGPCSLAAALDLASPGPGGVRLAVSSPNGDLVAFRFAEGDAVLIRRLSTLTGQAGSVGGTGEWLFEGECFVGQWRPG